MKHEHKPKKLQETFIRWGGTLIHGTSHDRPSKEMDSRVVTILALRGRLQTAQLLFRKILFAHDPGERDAVRVQVSFLRREAVRKSGGQQ